MIRKKRTIITKYDWLEIEMLKDISFDLYQLQELKKIYDKNKYIFLKEVIANMKEYLKNNIFLYIEKFKHYPDMEFLRRYLNT